MNEPATETGNGYRNEYLSVSRCKRYEQCAHGFELSYVHKRDGAQEGRSEFEEASEVGAALGSVVHGAFQDAYEWILGVEYSGTFPEAVLTDAFKERFKSSELRGDEQFNDGLKLLRAWCKRNRRVDHAVVLTVEEKFEFEWGGYSFLGFMDRVDKIDEETIEIVDYKTNRMLFTRDEVDADLQMSVYGAAAKRIWPWAKNIRYAFDMIRHGITMRTERTEEQLTDALGYMVAIGQRTETDTEFVPTLNSLCPWCRDRDRCEAYATALASDVEKLSALVVADNVEAVEAKYREFSAIEKAAKKRKADMEKILKAHTKKAGAGGLRVSGLQYKLVGGVNSDLPVAKCISVLGKFTDAVELAEFCKVERGKLDAWVESLELDKAKLLMLKAELGAVTERKPQRPRLSASKAKG